MKITIHELDSSLKELIMNGQQKPNVDVSCEIRVSTNDGFTIVGQKVFVKNINTDEVVEYTLTSNNKQVTLKPETRYEIWVDAKANYVTPSRQNITTGAAGSSLEVIFVYIKDEATLNVNVTTQKGNSVNGQVVYVKDMTSNTTTNHTLSSNNISIKVKSNRNYEVSLNDKSGCETPNKQTITSGEVGSSKSLSFVYKDIIIYGFNIDETNSDPSTAVTYTDDALGFNPLYMNEDTLDNGSWANTPILKGNKPCMFKDGLRKYYLNPNDYTKKVDNSAADITSGNEGDVMAEFNKMYYKMWKDGDIIKFRISETKVDDSYCCNAFLSEDGNAREKDFMYVGCYTSSNVSNKLRSISGKTLYVDHTIGTARTYATANGSGYQQMTLSKYTYINMLLILVTKSRDLQTKIGKGRSNSGNSNAISSGNMNTKGQFWGDQGGSNGCKVFHIENYWGNLFQFLDGLITLSHVNKYQISGPYNDIGTNYISGFTVPSSGYIGNMSCNNNNGLIPLTSSGSETTKYCDFLYTNTSTNISIFGGNWTGGSWCGPFYLNLNYSASATYSLFGSRLSFS